MRNRQAPAGMTLMEVTISSAILAAGFLLVMQIMKHMGDDMYAEQVESDLQKRVFGRVYDIVADLQGVVASDPQLRVLNNGTPVALGSLGNAIEYRVPSGTDAAGNPAYSGKIRYRWIISPRETGGNNVDDDQNGVSDDGRIVREQLDPATGNVLATFEVETYVPQTSRVTRKEDPYFGQTIPGFCVRRLAAPNSNQIVITVQRSASIRQRTDNGWVATPCATRTVYLENP